MAAQKAVMVTVVFIISLLFLLHPVICYSGSFMQRLKVLGSGPPVCADKCLTCRPCTATLVIPSHQRVRASTREEDETYYLLAWKCKCGDKLFQP